jgi:hypothetical protein
MTVNTSSFVTGSIKGDWCIAHFKFSFTALDSVCCGHTDTQRMDCQTYRGEVTTVAEAAKVAVLGSSEVVFPWRET